MKEVLFYTFKDYDNDSTIDETQPELYEIAVNIAEEVLQSELKEVILFGEHQAEVIDFYRYYATRRYNDFVYLIAVNANAETTYGYNIPLPSDVVGAAFNLFPDRPDDLSINNGNLTGALSPYQVAVYRFNTTATATDASVAAAADISVLPNPARTDVTLSYSLPEMTNFTTEIFNALGQSLFLQENTTQNAGRHSQNIDVSAWAAGVYYLRLTAAGGEGRSVRLMIR